jgi:hypothetical protein
MTKQGAKRTGRETGKKWVCFRTRSAEAKAERRRLERRERQQGKRECKETEP